MRTLRLQRILLGIAALAAVAAIIYLSYDRIAVYIFAKSNGLDIAYEGLKRAGVRMIFKKLEAASGSRGLGISAGSASIDPKLKGFDFVLTDVRFLKKGGGGTSSYDDVAGLVAVPFNGNWVYKEISGTVVLLPNRVEAKRIEAVSDEIKLKASGTFGYDNAIDTDITIYFAETLTKKIPQEFLAIVLADEGAGWRSLSVHLTGNYAKPSIQVSGKLFRLNIRALADK